MRPPTAMASSAAGTARRKVPSSSLTSMRKAWKVRLAGLPPVRRAWRRDRLLDDLGQPGRGRDRLALALAYQSFGYAPRKSFFPVVGKNAGEPSRRVRVDDLSRRQIPRPVHPHVERRVLGVGKAAARVIELRRGNAEIEQHGLDALVAEAGQDLGKLIIKGVHEPHPGRVGAKSLPGLIDRGLVGVDADDGELSG